MGTSYRALVPHPRVWVFSIYASILSIHCPRDSGPGFGSLDFPMVALLSHVVDCPICCGIGGGLHTSFHLRNLAIFPLNNTLSILTPSRKILESC